MSFNTQIIIHITHPSGEQWVVLCDYDGENWPML